MEGESYQTDSTTIRHPFHPQHTLTSNYSGNFACDACGRIYSGFNYHCEMCSFHLDPHCATSLTVLARLGGENGFPNLKHPHPLMLCVTAEEFDVPFSCCNKSFWGITNVYVCLQCHCLMHESCADWPLHIEHPFHSQHPLTLRIRPSTDRSQNRCNACGGVLKGFSFHCSACKFSLDLYCCLLMPMDQSCGEGMELGTQLLNHPHPLITCENITETKVICHGCKQCCKGPFYVCLHCQCFLDKSCAEWPQQIDHPFHPNHPLTLLVKHDHRSNWCKACGKGLQGLIFYCSECDFGLDLFCAALMPPQINQHQQLGHPHPLTLCKKKRSFHFTCYACQLSIEDSIYICLECRILLHRSCANLPRKIHRAPHPKHFDHCQNHTLTLLEHLPCELESPSGSKELVYVPETRPLQPKYYECSECLRVPTGFAYACSNCSDYLDIRCTMKKSKPHKHSLLFFNKPWKKLNCGICRRSLHTPFFRCVKCIFNIHVSCISILPQTVKCCHRHVLSLTYSPVKDYPDEDENTEFYCDVCEEPRDLFDPTYYCVECHFVAHVHCGFSEEMRVLVEEWSFAIELDETKLHTSSSMCEENVSEHNKITAKGVPSVAESKVKGPNSLLELDEEIGLLSGKIKHLNIQIGAVSKRKGELGERLQELKERRASMTLLL